MARPARRQEVTDGQVFEAVAKHDGESAAAFTCAAVKGRPTVIASSQTTKLRSRRSSEGSMMI